MADDHFENIYAHHAVEYEALVTREDYEGRLPRALHNIARFNNAEVVEFGAGTGRLTVMLAPHVARIRAYDKSEHMLAVARARLERMGLANWQTAAGDNRALPVEDACADVAIEGWSFGHLMFTPSWQADINAALGEMLRVARPGGVAIVIETMGTGSETPAPPAEELRTLYQHLEEELGFSAMAIRTDYRFESLEEAERLARFFFGDELADRVLREKLLILPECTGIWWNRH